MSSQPVEAAGPLIPMPQLTPDALRAAVAQILPSRLPELNEHLANAATSAQRTSSVGPLRAFTAHWGTVINIERWPQRAARFHACEDLASDPQADPEAARAAASEVSRILRVASEEIGT
ncbi:hypothetical protein [Streptomyces sp. XD-27]|uniref:hypothetical protein n=1 Tax=Streptomyces sp. XD-27 TaxID=3062779 RepID=UPI0026F46F1E|nr:hypothetical protein [Streptomyces sp. XD-27]WKX70192.1 hypothetical protein Q3Y56_09925 [Streptomyces sp. XD-27]